MRDQIQLLLHDISLEHFERHMFSMELVHLLLCDNFFWQKHPVGWDITNKIWSLTDQTHIACFNTTSRLKREVLQTPDTRVIKHVRLITFVSFLLIEPWMQNCRPLFIQTVSTKVSKSQRQHAFEINLHCGLNL